MENQFQKLLELTFEKESYTDIVSDINSNSTKKKKILIILKELLDLLEEVLFLFKSKPIITFVIKLLIKKFNKIIDEIGKE